MIKQFTHLFPNNKKITLKIDLSKNPPKIVSDYLFAKEDYGGDFEKEYLSWANIVVSEVFSNLNQEQIDFFE